MITGVKKFESKKIENEKETIEQNCTSMVSILLYFNLKIQFLQNSMIMKGKIMAFASFSWISHLFHANTVEMIIFNLLFLCFGSFNAHQESFFGFPVALQALVHLVAVIKVK